MTGPEIKKESSERTSAYELVDGQLLEAAWRMLSKHFGLDTADKWLREAYPPGLASKSHDATREALKSAAELWKRLVKDVGERQAKDIMHSVMGNKKTGRRGGLLMDTLILNSISMWPGESDEKIAKRIVESSPCRVRYESGAVSIWADWMSDARETTIARETIIKRTPIKMSLSAIKKQVGRIRRWAIAVGLLGEVYAHKRYYLEKDAGGSGGG
jgi:hypothetical protein